MHQARAGAHCVRLVRKLAPAGAHQVRPARAPSAIWRALCPLGARAAASKCAPSAHNASQLAHQARIMRAWCASWRQQVRTKRAPSAHNAPPPFKTTVPCTRNHCFHFSTSAPQSPQNCLLGQPARAPSADYVSGCASWRHQVRTKRA